MDSFVCTGILCAIEVWTKYVHVTMFVIEGRKRTGLA